LFCETLAGTAHCENSKLNEQGADLGKQRIALVFPFVHLRATTTHSHHHHQQSTFATLLFAACPLHDNQPCLPTLLHHPTASNFVVPTTGVSNASI
jgi:hypothetical protein